MAKAIGVFGYRILDRPKKGGIPHLASVHIFPKDCIESEKLMSEQEIADYVQACKEDLDHVGRLAKRALKRANQET